jgi:hypothetical protein
LGELMKYKLSKSILPPKSHVRLDISDPLARFQKLWMDISGPQARHVRSSSLSRVNPAYSAPYLGFRGISRTCPAPCPDVSGLT